MRALVMVGVGLSAVSLGQPVLIDRIALVIDGQPVFQSAIEARVRQNAAGKPLSEATRGPALERARAELIDAVLIEKNADVTVTDAEVEGALDDIAKANQLDRAQLTAAAKAQGLSMPEYRAMLRGQILELRWLMARAREHGVAPKDERERADAFAALRAKLLGQLKKRAVIEVFE